MTARAAGTPEPSAQPAPPVRVVRTSAPAMWSVIAGVALATLLAVLLDVTVGVMTLAATLVAAGLARAVLPEPGPEGITVRTRTVDVVLHLSAAAVLVFLAIIAPDA
ncbi:DUF3017 family protein [Cellulomonas sp. PhB143]|nr:DUF3017 family protein [Cellulomonas sp. PhB143]